MYSLLKPNAVIPVHGNFEQLKANAEIAKSCKVKKILIPKNGDMFQFIDDNPTFIDRIEMDTKVFDGEKVVSLKDEKFSIRKQALWNGVLMASIVLDNRGNLISVPILTELGISKTEKMKNALLEISLKIEDYIEGLNETDSLDDDNLKEILKKIILKEVRILFSIRPVVNIHINRVQ